MGIPKVGAMGEACAHLPLGYVREFLGPNGLPHHSAPKESQLGRKVPITHEEACLGSGERRPHFGISPYLDANPMSARGPIC
jgi:hypothetical protein